MIIKDELYGTMEFGELEHRIIDTPDFQRLHRIKQMALTYLVYPGATHSRFEHSLGTAHLASEISEKLGMEKELKNKIRLYALIHDIGHVAFSHESEVILKKYIGNHEEIGKKMVLEGKIGDIINENYSANEIMDFENNHYGKIVTSDLGADRMDYLKRDSQNTGAAYGIIDVDRILHTLKMKGDELILTEGGLTSAESLLIGRFMMFSNVYMHKAVRIAAAMLRRAIKSAIEGGLDPKEFIGWGDEEAFFFMDEIKTAKEYVKRIRERQLYKEIASIDSSEISHSELEQMEERLIRKAKCDIIIDPPNTIFKPVDIKVSVREELIQITKVSDIVEALKTSEKRRQKLMIIGEEKNKDKILELVRKEFKQL